MVNSTKSGSITPWKSNFQASHQPLIYAFIFLLGSPASKCYARAMRKTIFAEGEFYHIYNRGTDKRDIYLDGRDYTRFLESMIQFNSLEPIGSIFENSFRKKQLGSPASKRPKREGRLVNIIAYCLNPNHYHFILEQVAEKGVEKFMQRLGTGYTKYFNNRYVRTGVLFQGKFKAVHIDSNPYLLHVSAYVNLNNRVHQLGSRTSKSSWDEYTTKYDGPRICEKEIILGQFQKPQEYINFAEESIRGTLARRGILDSALLLE